MAVITVMMMSFVDSGMQYRKTIVFCLLILGLFIHRPVFADVIGGQTDNSATVMSEVFNQRLGTGWSGTVSSIGIFAQYSGGGFTDLRLYCYTDSAYTTFCGTGQIVARSQNDTGNLPALAISPTIINMCWANPSTGALDCSHDSYVMDPTKYYRIQVGPSTVLDKTWGSTSLILTGWQGTVLTSAYYVLYDNQAIKTKIISVTPFDKQVIASTSVATLGYTVLLATTTDAFFSGYTIRFKVYGVNDLLQYAGANNGVVLDYSTSTNSIGIISFATTTSSYLNGNYNIDISITKNTIFSIFQPADAATTTSFIAGQPTVFGSYYQQQQAQQTAFFNSMATTSNTASSTIPDACAILTFNLGGCISGILIPTGPQLSQWFNTFQATTFNMFPLGYVKRTITILTSTTTTPLPALSFTFPNSFPSATFAGQTYGFDFTAISVQAADLINNKLVSTSDGKSVWQIFEGPINIFLALWLIFLIVSDILELDVEVRFTREQGRMWTSMDKNGNVKTNVQGPRWRRNIKAGL